MFNLIIRAVTDKGEHVDLVQIRMDALLTFTMIYKCAQEEESFPDVSWIPNVWKNEIYPEFMNREGSIVAFLMIKPEVPERTLNLMYFKVDDEGRRTLKILHEDIIRASEVLISSAPDIQGHLRKHEKIHDEMSADWHMGYHEESKDLVVRKDRIPGDNSGVFEFPSISDLYLEQEADYKEGIATTFEESKIIDLAPKQSYRPPDWYSESAMDKTQYRIYINGHPSTMAVDDISFMNQIHEKSADGQLTIMKDVPGHMEMPQYLFDILSKFIHERNFKIGAHPVQEVLEDGNDAEHSIFWNHGEKKILYVSPTGSGRY